MATLLSNAKLGNTGVSGLIKSATTLQNEMNTYQDAQMAQDYALSSKTASDLSTYQNYLQSRVSTLNSTGSITDATKAISLTNTLYSAIKTNGSADIQRENIQVMAGNATLSDKYSTIVDQYSRAVGIGDMALAQSLESQAYSVSQSIQYQAQTAADASTALAKAGASSTAGGEEHIATNLNMALKQLNSDIQGAGQKQFNSIVSKWVASNSDTLKALGVSLPKGAQPNYFDIANGVAGAIYNAHMLAYQAELPYNPDTAQTYYNQAISLATGDTKLQTLAGSKTASEIQQAAANPAQFAYDSVTGTLEQTQQSGYQYAGNKVIPTYSGSIVKVATPQLTAQLAKLGLQFNGTSSGNASNGQEVQATKQTPQWLRNILGPNGVTNVFVAQNGSLQFEGDTNQGKAIYTIAKDNTGKYGLYQQDPNGKSVAIGGDYGFNQQINSVINPKATQAIHSLANGNTDQLAGVFGNMNNMSGVQNLINSGQQTQAQIAAANAVAAKAMLANAPPPLPNISIAPPPVARTITPSAPAAPQTVSVSQAQPVASPAKSPQNPSGINIQGGGGIRLQ
jgi:hypothetical protein